MFCINTNNIVRIGTLAVIILIQLGAQGTTWADERPNFVFIIADDMGYEDCGVSGNPKVRTVNLDRLAESGINFERAFLTCSSCSPSRSSMITCRYPHQTDAEQLHWPLPANQTTYVQLLKDAGYYTAASGKWHLGEAAKKHFDFVGEASSAGFQLPSKATGNDPKPVMTDENNASGCAGWVKTLADRPTDKPFFLWLAAIDPHRDYLPNIISEPHRAEDAMLPPFIPDTREVREDFALYYDEITRLDNYVGEVLKELDRQGVADKTMVVFVSDNGRAFPRCKTTVFDSGIHTPLFVRFPKLVASNIRCQQLISSIDIGATILDLAGVKAADTMQGQSFKAVLENPKAEHRSAVFAEHNWHDYDAHQRAVRTARFKYIRNFDHDLTLSPPADAVRSPTYASMKKLRDLGQLNSFQKQCFDKPRTKEELYDLEKDPHELANVAQDASYATALEQHRQLLDQWRQQTRDEELTVRAPDEFDRESGDPLKNRRRPRPTKSELRNNPSK